MNFEQWFDEIEHKLDNGRSLTSLSYDFCRMKQSWQGCKQEIIKLLVSKQDKNGMIDCIGENLIDEIEKKI